METRIDYFLKVTNVSLLIRWINFCIAIHLDNLLIYFVCHHIVSSCLQITKLIFRAVFASKFQDSFNPCPATNMSWPSNYRVDYNSVVLNHNIFQNNTILYSWPRSNKYILSDCHIRSNHSVLVNLSCWMNTYISYDLFWFNCPG
jgi:hypothetical protein